MGSAATDNNSSPENTATRPPVSGPKVLGIMALVTVLVVIIGGIVLMNAVTDPGFRTSAMEKRVRAGVPAGWTMKVTGSSEHSGPCIDGCDGSSLDVTLTSSEPPASRASQQRELAKAMRAGGWGYHAPLTRAQSLAPYLQEYPTDLGDPPVDTDDETIMFDPHNAGLFEGGPSSTRSTVSYEITARWYDGQFSLTLLASQGE